VFVGQGLVEFGEFLGHHHGLGFFGKHHVEGFPAFLGLGNGLLYGLDLLVTFF
jgi:hypothetical protein